VHGFVCHERSGNFFVIWKFLPDTPTPQLYMLQSWTKPLRPFQPILQSYWTLTKQIKLCLPLPSPQVNVVNNAETTFGNIPWHKLNIELGERGLKKGNMIQHGAYHKNMSIFYRGKIVSTSYVQDCSYGPACSLIGCSSGRNILRYFDRPGSVILRKEANFSTPHLLKYAWIILSDKCEIKWNMN
jgi:hypothetical protein